MGCGRIGAQQRARVMGRSPTPSISTGERDAPTPLRDLARVGGTATCVVDSAVEATFLTGAAAGRADEAAADFPPPSLASSRRRKKARSFARLREDTRYPLRSASQSRLGAGSRPVMMSTTSPLFSAWFSGVIRPLIFA